MSACRPLFRVIVECFLPKTLSLGEVELPARVFNHTSGYQVRATELVFDEVPDERSLKALVTIVEASAIGQCRQKPRFTVETLLYSATQRRWTQKALNALSEKERRRNQRAMTNVLFSRLTSKALLKALGQTPAQKIPTSWNTADEFFLCVSYQARLAWDVVDAEVRKAIGRASDGSGCGFGQRDLTFRFSQADALRAALKRLGKISSRTTVALGRNFYNGRGEWIDSNELCLKQEPSKAALLLT